MRLDAHKIKTILNHKEISINKLLKQAGVSKTAYYALRRRDSILPRSLRALAQALDISPRRILTDPDDEVKKASRRLRKVEAVLAAYPGADRDTVWQTLVHLEEKPIDRLRWALRRGRQFNFR